MNQQTLQSKKIEIIQRSTKHIKQNNTSADSSIN